ncbi:MAG: flagellin [Lachnospiraceae bacterium]|jgi:flagellin|nr:flagellin [Lachnospiraceae bacterium]
MISRMNRSQNVNLYQNLQKNYQQLSTGKKINTAADNAAGLAIAQKLLTQSNGYDMGTRNAATSQDMINVAEGSLSTISDSLQRIRELSIQASNTAVYGDDDRAAIQQEIDQLKQSISDAGKNTQFNNKNLLDGSMKSSHVASGPDGSGMDINMPDAVLESLGIADFDVTKDFDISQIDSAIDKVSSARSGLGAAYNRLGHTINYNAYASYNITASRSRLEDLDYGAAVSDMKKNSLLQEYRLMMQKKQEDENGRFIQLLRFNS